jgi:hypothetical protein
MNRSGIADAGSALRNSERPRSAPVIYDAADRDQGEQQHQRDALDFAALDPEEASASRASPGPASASGRALTRGAV